MSEPLAPADHAPTTVFWDISARCNGRCGYCSAAPDLNAGHAEPLGAADAARGLERLHRAGVAGLVFLGGEPTLREDLPDLVARAGELGLAVSIATNGLAMPRRLLDVVLEQPRLAINVSLDSAFAEENDAVRGSGYHAACVRTLRMLLDARRATGAPIVITIQATLTVHNLKRLATTLHRFLDLGVDQVMLERMRPYPWQPKQVRAWAPSHRQKIRAAGVLARVARRLDAHGRLLLNYGLARLRAALQERYGFAGPIQRFCPAGLEVAVLDFRGRLHPCREAPLRSPAGADGTPYYAVESIDVRTEQAAGFLESSYFVDFFNFAHSVHTYEHLPVCATCDHFEVCEPCPLDAVACRGPGVGECLTLMQGCRP